MKFKFDWETVVRGEIEIDAENGQEAERLFRQMSASEKMKKSITTVDAEAAQIKFIDFDWCDTVTYDEWKKNWNLTPEKWEEWGKSLNV